LACNRLKSSVGGLVFGRYIREGRGWGCARYRGRIWAAERGREVNVWERMGLLVNC
jgi:hypothetical protein